jgi:hypothetical protein
MRFNIFPDGHLEKHRFVRETKPWMPARRSARLAAGKAVRSVRLGIDAEPRHHEQRKPSTSIPPEASGIAVDDPSD